MECVIRTILLHFPTLQVLLFKKASRALFVSLEVPLPHDPVEAQARPCHDVGGRSLAGEALVLAKRNGSSSRKEEKKQAEVPFASSRYERSKKSWNELRPMR